MIPVHTTAAYEGELHRARHTAGFSATLELEVQTDKPEGKLVPCRGCQRPLLVNRFYSAAQASCKECGLSRALTGKGAVASAVTADDLESTRDRWPECRCEELGLRVGLPVAELVDLEEGCTGSRQRARLQGTDVGYAGPGGWVCPRLDKIRRRHGK